MIVGGSSVREGEMWQGVWMGVEAGVSKKKVRDVQDSPGKR